MLDWLFSSVLTTPLTAGAFFTCTLTSMILGVVIALVCAFRNQASRSFVLSMAILPVLVQVVIMLVNGNLGAGVAVAGAFSLVRFRSLPGTAREISCIFLSVVVGLATGMGYIGVALLTAVLIGLIGGVFSLLRYDGNRSDKADRDLRLIIPESLNYTEVFDDLMERYTTSCELIKVKTINMGSMYQLMYRITLKDMQKEKEFLDELRCRNGNLEISCCRIMEELPEKL